MTDTTAIAIKIKALLAKAAGTTNQHEAEAFLAKAHEMMEKYQLDALDLDADDPMGEDGVYRRNGTAAPDWDFRLMFACARYYGCKGIQMPVYGEHPKTGRYQHLGYEMALIGRESARLTTVQMHKYLVDTVRKLGREAAEGMGCKPDQAARRIGVALRTRLNQLATPAPVTVATAASKNALMTLDAVQQWLTEHHPDTRPINGRSFTNQTARTIAGGIGINVQAGSSASTLRLA
jgi:hypothetical protein